MSTQTIELDTTQPWEPPEPPTTHRVMPRWVVAALVLALAPVAPLASAPIGSPYAPIFTGRETGAMLFVNGDTMFEAPTDRFQSQRLRAYDLASGKLRWERGLEDDDDANWSAHDGVLYQTLGRPPQPSSMFVPQRLRALDPATGRTIWEREKVGVEVAADGVTILREWPDRGEQSQEPPVEHPSIPLPQPATMYAVESRTGKQLWTRTLVNHWTFTYRSIDWADPWGMRPMEDVRLAELSPSGELRLTDLRSGQTGPPVQMAFSGPLDYFEIQDDVLTARRGDDLTGYDIKTGREVWRHEAPEDGSRCGLDFVCVSRFHGDGHYRLRIVKQSTGRTVLELSDAMVTGMMGTRLLIQGDYRSGVRETSIIDLAGDQAPRSLAPWGSARAIDDHRILVVAHVVAAARTTIAVLDIDTGYAVVVGQVRGWYVPPDCTRHGEYIMCLSASDRAVWKLPAELRSRRK